jgi:GNAT superfamily N-acetyltransferase
VPPAVTELEFVPASDPALEARVWTALNPDEPLEPATARVWWEYEDREGSFERFAIRSGGEEVGFALAGHFSWSEVDERYARLNADFLPEHRSHFSLSAGYEFVEQLAIDSGAQHLLAQARESDDFLILQLRRRGYAGKRIFRWWELDLVEKREHLTRLAQHSRQRMQEQGIELVTLASAGKDDETLHELADLHWEASQDIPRDEPRVRPTDESFRAWLTAPGVHDDRFWLARHDGRFVGISYLEYRDTGHAWTGWTGTARSVRGRGVARALKLETLTQAMEFGVTRTRTENDAENAPILHLNEEFGYRPIPGLVQFHRPADVKLEWNYRRAIFRDLGV